MINKLDYSKFKLKLKKKSKMGSKEDIARMAAPKAAQFLYDALRIGPRLILRSAFELLRANIITRLISAVVLISFDTVAFARKRISLKQYLINVSIAAMLLVGGTAGWYLGNGAVYVLLENAVLAIIGGILGAGLIGVGLGAVLEKIIKRFVKDDSADMLEICNEVFCELAQKYNLNEQEAEIAANSIEIDATTVRAMYASPDKTGYACEIIEKELVKLKS